MNGQNIMYGLVRVSTKEQNEDRQVQALIEFGVNKKNIFIDKESGANFERKNYKKLLSIIKPGDILIVKSIDRFGRNYDEILEQWRIINKVKNVDIVVLDMPLLDTRSDDRDLTGTFIADIVLQILSYVAEVERDNIKARQAEGIAIAMEKGVKFGRKPLEIPDNFPIVYGKWLNNEISAREAGRILSVTHVTFLKWTRSAENCLKNL